MKISKSKFMAGVQCLKRLYFLAHDPELVAQPGAADGGIIGQSREVGLIARQGPPTLGGCVPAQRAGLRQ